MAYRYVFQPLKTLNWRGVRWKPAGIYHVNATTTGATSGTEITGSKNCEGFYPKYYWFNVK